MAKEKNPERECGSPHISTSGNSLQVWSCSYILTAYMEKAPWIIRSLPLHWGNPTRTNVSVTGSNFLHSHLDHLLILVNLKKKKKIIVALFSSGNSKWWCQEVSILFARTEVGMSPPLLPRASIFHSAEFSKESCINTSFQKANGGGGIFRYKNGLLQLTWFYLGKRFLDLFSIIMSQWSKTLYIMKYRRRGATAQAPPAALWNVTKYEAGKKTFKLYWRHLHWLIIYSVVVQEITTKSRVI